MSWILRDLLSVVEKKKDLQGLDALERSGRLPSNDLAADIAGAGFKTEIENAHNLASEIVRPLVLYRRELGPGG